MRSFLVTRHLSPVTLFGGHKAVVRPDPIPNSAVKHSLADGSSSIGSARVGCRQFLLKAETPKCVSAFFVFCQGRVGILNDFVGDVFKNFVPTSARSARGPCSRTDFLFCVVTEKR